jgi:hypothetical protein
MRIIFCSAVFLAGVIFLTGAIKKWKWLVDPDERYWLFYSQSLLKKIFGKEFVLYYTFVLGIAFTLAGVALLISTIFFR